MQDLTPLLGPDYTLAADPPTVGLPVPAMLLLAAGVLGLGFSRRRIAT